MTIANKPKDVRPKWAEWAGRLTRRLQQASRTQEGYAIVSMVALVDMNGDPVLEFYTEPKIIKLEPKRQIALDSLKEKLSPDDLQNILHYIVFTQ